MGLGNKEFLDSLIMLRRVNSLHQTAMEGADILLILNP